MFAYIYLDKVRRAQLRAELDAYYACLYGLIRDELRYIIDPKGVHGEFSWRRPIRMAKRRKMSKISENRMRCQVRRTIRN